MTIKELCGMFNDGTLNTIGYQDYTVRHRPFLDFPEVVATGPINMEISISWYDHVEMLHTVTVRGYNEGLILKQIVKMYNVAPRIKGMKIK